MCVCVRACMHANVRAYVRVRVRVFVWVCVWVWVCACVGVRVCVSVQYSFLHMHWCCDNLLVCFLQWLTVPSCLCAIVCHVIIITL